MSDDQRLYDVNVNTAAGPHEVAEFCDLLEANGYMVITDLAHGKLRIEDGEGE